MKNICMFCNARGMINGNNRHGGGLGIQCQNDW